MEHRKAACQNLMNWKLTQKDSANMAGGFADDRGFLHYLRLVRRGINDHRRLSRKYNPSQASTPKPI